METIKKILEWLKLFPLWARCLLLALISAALVVVSACGTPKTTATVTNVNPNSSVTVTMTVSNTTTSTPTVETTPSFNLQN